jgi:hypothetical protein
LAGHLKSSADLWYRLYTEMDRRSTAQDKSSVQVAALISLDTHRWLKERADGEHRSVASVVRQVLEQERQKEAA